MGRRFHGKGVGNRVCIQRAVAVGIERAWTCRWTFFEESHLSFVENAGGSIPLQQQLLQTKKAVKEESKSGGGQNSPIRNVLSIAHDNDGSVGNVCLLTRSSDVY